MDTDREWYTDLSQLFSIPLFFVNFSQIRIILLLHLFKGWAPSTNNLY